jgi:acetyl-CoA acetyltransferase
VYVVGTGLHRYQHKTDTTYVQLGLTAVRAALADAGIAWPDVETAYTGTALLGMAVKNHRNGARNPVAQRQRVRTLEEVMAEPISGSMSRLQCCPVGEGAAALVVASDDAIARLGIDRSRAVRVLASATRSEGLYPPGVGIDAALTVETAHDAFEQAGVAPTEMDVLEVHDAFSIEELLYTEALGFCEPGQAASLVASGELDLGGRCAISPSGGLLAMGHPIGPTGAGQVVDTPQHGGRTCRLRARQPVAGGTAGTPTIKAFRLRASALADIGDDDGHVDVVDDLASAGITSDDVERRPARSQAG